MKHLLLILLTFSFGFTPAYATEKSPYGIATASSIATRVGSNIIQKGGNAFDAAVAISAALAVVEPYSSGIGGGGFWLLHRNSDRHTVMIDGRERAPLLASRNMYLDKKGDFQKHLSIKGALAGGIPGVPAALVHIAEQYGKLPISDSLQASIDLARNGFVIDEKYRLYAKLRLESLRANAEAARIFLHNNNVPPKNHVLKQTDLANTLETLAKNGRDGFYTGKVATQLVTGIRKGNGIWKLDDLAKYTIRERQPISFTYKDLDIISAAPPSSGGIALAEILGILENYKLNNMTAASRTHVIIEAMKRAYADRAEFLGDPDFSNVPVKMLTGKKNINRWSKDITLQEATPSEFINTAPTPGGNGTDTTHFSVIDTEGNIVSATLSINYPFGACFVPPGTGVLINDEMDDFSAKPGVANAYGLVGGEANAIAPGKRPLSSMSPTIILGRGKAAALGTPGGSRIITMVLLAILEYANGASAADIVSKRRFHHQYLPDHVMYEDGAISSDTRKALQDMGHKLKRKKSPYGGGRGSYGNMQIVIQDRKHNTISAASDPRGIGKELVSVK